MAAASTEAETEKVSSQTGAAAVAMIAARTVGQEAVKVAWARTVGREAVKVAWVVAVRATRVGPDT